MKRVLHHIRRVPNSFLCGIVVIGVAIFAGLTIFEMLYRVKDDAGMIIASDVVKLRDVFHRIHRDCTIIDFDAQKNPINFLNVEKFAGSEVGPMNLVHPEKWNGPYLKENPTIYHTAYQVVVTKKGYFIAPGDGVELPNKKVVGKDIVLDKRSNIAKMVRDPESLLYKDKELSARLEIGAPTNLQFFLNDEDEE